MCWPVIPDSSAIHALKVNMATESCFKKHSLCKLQATQFLLSLQNKWLNCLVATDGKTAGPISCINVRRFACANFFKNECLVFLGENCICHIWFSREWKAGERKKFVPGGERRSKGRRGEEVGQKERTRRNYFSPSFVTFKNFGIYPWQPSCFGLCRLCGSWCFPHNMRTKRIQGRTHNSLYWHKPTT